MNKRQNSPPPLFSTNNIFYPSTPALLPVPPTPSPYLPKYYYTILSPESVYFRFYRLFRLRNSIKTSNKFIREEKKKKQ